MIEMEGEKGSWRMSETHYSRSKQRFMLARTYYSRAADEQNAGERESWKKAMHYSLDFLRLSHSSPLLQLFLDLSLYFPFLSHLIVPLPPLCFCPFVYSKSVSLFIFIFLDTRHFPSPCNLVREHTSAHTRICLCQTVPRDT